MAHKKVSNRSYTNHSEEVKAKAIAFYKDKWKSADIEKALGVKVPTMYGWFRKAGLIPGRQTALNSKRKIKTKVNKFHPIVYEVMRDIENERKKEFSSFSLESDFSIPQVTDIKESKSNVELKFCPCCGTNIRAVLLALQTCK